MNNRWLFKVELFDYVVEDVLWDVKILLVLPELRLADEARCNVLGVIILDDLDFLLLLVDVSLVESFVFLLNLFWFGFHI